MTEEKLIKTVNWLLFFAAAFLFHGLTYYVTDRMFPEETVSAETTFKDQFTSKDFGATPTYAWWNETEPSLEEFHEVEEKYIPVLVTYKQMKLTSLGTYYITAYCPSECGYNGSNYPKGWETASGAICHRASYNYRLTEPTTCAISRSKHKFGEVFYIKEFDRTFIGEDTGSAVKGKHLDLFYEDYSDVQSFPTGYYEVFKVEWVEVTVPLTEEEYKALKEMGALEYFTEKEAEGYEFT